MDSETNRPLHCMECGLLYKEFGIDVNVPDDQWVLLMGRPAGDGMMCGACLIEAGAKHKQFTWAYLEFKE